MQRPAHVLARLSLLSALLAAALALAGCFGPMARLHREMVAEAQYASIYTGLVGSWQVEASPQVDPHVVTVLATLTGDGSVLVSDPAQPGTGHGAWSPTGPNRADLTYITLLVNDDGTPAATVKTSAGVEYDPATDTVSGRYTVTATDPGGTVISSNYGPLHGTRIVAEAPGPVPAASPSAADDGAATEMPAEEATVMPTVMPTEEPTEEPTETTTP